jgi:hypothetical protein
MGLGHHQPDASSSLPFDLDILRATGLGAFSFALRGLTLDSASPDHHGRIYVNQVPPANLFQ